MKKFSTQLAWLKFQPGLTILSCNRFNPGLKLFMSYSNMCGSDYLLQENTMEAFLLPGINAENIEHFNHLKSSKISNPVNFNRAEFNPGVESAPCNRPLTCNFSEV